MYLFYSNEKSTSSTTTFLTLIFDLQIQYRSVPRPSVTPLNLVVINPTQIIQRRRTSLWMNEGKRPFTLLSNHAFWEKAGWPVCKCLPWAWDVFCLFFVFGNCALFFMYYWAVGCFKHFKASFGPLKHLKPTCSEALLQHLGFEDFHCINVETACYMYIYAYVGRFWKNLVYYAG